MKTVRRVLWVVGASLVFGVTVGMLLGRWAAEPIPWDTSPTVWSAP